MPKVGIRTRYQRAQFAALLARTMEKHPDMKVAAVAKAIGIALAAPMEIVNSSLAGLCSIAPEIETIIWEMAKEPADPQQKMFPEAG